MIHNAIVKYGVEQFTFEILYICPITEMNKWETFYITIFGTLTPNGYNLNMGGDNKEISNETKKKMSESRKGMLTGNKNPMDGKTGSKNIKSRKINIDGKDYIGLRETSKLLGMSYSAICYRLRSDMFPNYKYI